METLNQTLIDCVRAAGGSAIVGPKLWPEKLNETAQRNLLDCLNEERPAKLSPDQVLLVLRLAREKGYHGGVNYILQALGYAPTTPVEPKDEVADLMRTFQSSVALQADLVVRMEKAASRVGLKAQKAAT
ncbi:MAG: hypothetical protein V4451_17020 [Pseudomonadota bacterium]